MLGPEARIWFFSDIHGSQKCFRKFLNLVKNPNKPNVLIIGGDITGKVLIPFVEIGNNQLRYHSETGDTTIHEGQFSDVARTLEDVGCYIYRCDEARFRQLSIDRLEYQRVFDELARARILEWVALADEKLSSVTDCQIFINCGNDDPLFVDALLDKSRTMQRPEGKIIDLPAGLKLLSTGYSNISPWNCPRDISEDDLLSRIGSMTQGLKGQEGSRAIFNFHCPPKDTFLDAAIEIDPITKKKRVGARGPAIAHVGSTAVRKAIQTFQPLAGLHGHIHSANAQDRIGRTRCYNPGSDYASGNLQGVFLVINDSGIAFEQLTSERDAKNDGEHPAAPILRLLPIVGRFFSGHSGSTN